ncbi:hypothetical protein ES703_23798 [subsurface metagenome]
MGQSDRAMSFDGVDDQVKSDLVYANNPYFTVAGWIYPRGYGGSFGVIVGTEYGHNLRSGLALHPTNKLYYHDYGDPHFQYLIKTLTLNNWYHVAFTYNDGAIKGYVNGVEEASFSHIKYGISAKTIIGRSTSSYLGAYRAFDGSISNVRIYNHALSAEEIDTLYHSYRPKVASGSLLKGLVFDMPLKFKYTKDETPGSEILTDRTPYSNDGQNYGAVVGADYTTFDGENDHVDVGAWLTSYFNGKTKMSISAWIYPRDVTTYQHIYSRGVLWSEGNILIYVKTGYIAFGMHGLSGGWKTFYIDPNYWYHVVGVMDLSLPESERFKLYVDGIYKVSTGHPATSVPDRSDATQIGTRETGYFDGSISNVRIYNRALSPSEIKLLHDQGR